MVLHAGLHESMLQLSCCVACCHQTLTGLQQEHFLVPDHRIKSISGASFAGFYYICVQKSTQTILGLYFHQNSEYHCCCHACVWLTQQVVPTPEAGTRVGTRLFLVRVPVDVGGVEMHT